MVRQEGPCQGQSLNHAFLRLNKFYVSKFVSCFIAYRVKSVIEKDDLCRAVRVLRNEDISRVGVAVNIAEFEDHVRIHLADFPRHFVRVDFVFFEVFSVVDVSA